MITQYIPNIISEIRRDNLSLLIGEIQEKQTLLAQKIGSSDTYISSILNRGARMGNKLARRIEVIYEKPVGWLDTQQSHIDVNINKDKSALEVSIQAARDAMKGYDHVFTPEQELDILRSAIQGGTKHPMSEEAFKAIIDIFIINK